MNKKEVKRKLQKIADNRESTELKARVADMLIEQLEGYENPEDMFSDIQAGCSSGVISGLIYYKDTYQFAKDYLKDIIELYQQGIENYGLQMPTDTDGLNWLAWFGFEQTASEIQSDIGIDL